MRGLQVCVSTVPGARRLPWQRGASEELAQAQRAWGSKGDGRLWPLLLLGAPCLPPQPSQGGSGCPSLLPVTSLSPGNACAPSPLSWQ